MVGSSFRTILHESQAHEGAHGLNFSFKSPWVFAFNAGGWAGRKRDFTMKALKLLAVLIGLVAISACSEEADKSAETPPASTEQPASE